MSTKDFNPFTLRKPGALIRFMDPKQHLDRPFGHIVHVAHIDPPKGPAQSGCALCKAGSPTRIYVLKRRAPNPNTPRVKIHWDADAMSFEGDGE